MIEENKLPTFRLSVSKYKTFESCKKKYEFAYILKLPRKDFEHFTFGKFCHAVLENFHNTYLEGSDKPSNIAMSEAYKKASIEYGAKLTPEMKAECKDIATTYLKKIASDKQQGIAPQVIGVEKNFSTPIGDKVLLNGMIDKIQIDADNVLHVADYKTTKDKKYLKNDWGQLLTYAYVLLIEDPTIEKVRGSYIMLRHNFEPITKDFSREEILAVGDQYIKYAEEITSEKEFPANPSFLCSYCDFLEHCDQGLQRIRPKTISGEIKW